ncbi:hypothetical protein Fmac_005980 [Flemingia macrophylla]|uniref:Uncharacterized protein n=1 Tax=Flemingia macrophylla TaxID=520843 RepID=A0ABD1N9F7_9FABA
MKLLPQSIQTFIATSRFDSATPVPPSMLSRGVGCQMNLIFCTLNAANDNDFPGDLSSTPPWSTSFSSKINRLMQKDIIRVRGSNPFSFGRRA